MVLVSGGKHIENHSENSNKQAQNLQGPQKIDYLGIGALTITITSFLAAIELFGKGKPDITAPLVLLGVAFCFGILFLLVEAYHAKEPLIPLSLLRTVLGIHFLVQVLLSLGRQAVFSPPLLLALYKHSERRTLTSLHSMYQASPHISSGQKALTRLLLHYALFHPPLALLPDLSFLVLLFKSPFRIVLYIILWVEYLANDVSV